MIAHRQAFWRSMAPLRPLRLRLRLGVFVERVHALVQEHRQPLDVVARSHHRHRYISARLPDGADEPAPRCQTHSIINRPSKPAWLKDLAVIDMSLYRRFYRHKRRSFAGAGDGAICGGATFSTLSSIKCKHTEKRTAPQDSPRSPERALRLRQQCSQNFGGAVKL